MNALTVSLLMLFAPSTAQRDQPENAAGNPDKIVCKRFAETGSLVKSYRTCQTKREWERERDNIRQSNVSNSCGAEFGVCR
jgi:hypothetical protein